jgi:alpha-beta hydrolase superfamily lysophospholipase
MEKMKRVTYACLLVGVLCMAGCVSLVPQASYRINMGSLSLTVPGPSVQEEVLTTQDGITVSRLSFQNINQMVYVLLAAPDAPHAVVILAPGAGVKKEGHRNRAEEYARAGIAMAVLDIRGNGGETSGTPLDIESDYRLFTEGSWPQYYAIVADIIATREFLDSRYLVPTFAMGESNGGRYAAIAVAADKDFCGYIGISTSGFGLIGNQYTGKAREFLLSIDPDHAVAEISPAPVLLFHAPDDSIIPYTDGKALFLYAREPKFFYNLSTGHGLNGEADQKIIEYLLNFNVPERQ